ncbi:Dynamin family protein [Hyella patelloides LEGE 07179]|uniref:Dynamin family protein n=1 Tax=Hyella patelloides LEGE 07179 TaxID=945734 RepID=A0A563VKU9_9CYAN|nr:dynamin family protein [Hyella patelloides]VEP12074.1 Dynamin family protein [Hyella patelloides LEGE 07179]
MTKSENYWQNLADRLKTLIAILELDPESSLAQDAIALTDFLTKTSFQIAVFAPFNHGKSTLLNALLGQKSLPIDLIPSTGAAITIKYGIETKTTITLQDGTKKITSDTKILQEYAILDSDRKMRNDLQAIEVTCNYPLLKNGVELLDLPGTNDREAQDNLVKDKLLTANLIIHVLDARKLMTLLEREKLRDWLQARGVHTVIFVVNFLNLLEAEDQKKVYNRLKFVAESFRSELPAGISNLYRVDALPALRARLKGDYTTVMETGLTNLETALQNIIKANSKQPETKLTRIKNITEQLITTAREKRANIKNKLDTTQQKQQQQIAIKQKAAQLIKQGLQRSISEFESWLYLPNLLKIEQAKLAIALQQEDFKIWKNEFNQTVGNYQQAIFEWLAKSQEFFPVEKPIKLIINFPEPPHIEKDNFTKNQETTNNYEPTITEEIDKIFNKAVNTILSGNAQELFTSFTGNSQSQSDINKSNTKPQKSRSQIYAEAAENYLISFSQQTFISLQEYQNQAEKLINYQPQAVTETNTIEEHQLQLLDNAIENLQQELNHVTNR